MYTFCTYCSASKSHEEGEISAIRRYQSLRIKTVHAAASSLGLGFHILSGEYGLLSPEHPIPWYDHLLRPEEVGQLVERVAEQIDECQISSLVYFTNSLAKEPTVVPYHNVIVAACSLTGRPFIVVEIDGEFLSD
jgi:hypothetical protein